MGKLIARFDPNADKAKEKLVFIYGNLIGFFKKCGNLSALPEEYAIETIFRAAQSLKDDQEIKNLSAYIFKVAWNVLHETWREKKNRTTSLEEILVEGEPASYPDDEEERSWFRWKKRRLKLMQQCLEKRSSEERALLQQYVEAKAQDAVEALAKRLQMSINTLRIQIHRIRKELKLCVKARQKDS